MPSRIVLIFAVFFSSVAQADTFDVQIGAFRNPAAASISLPADVGEMRSERGADGLTRFVVGPFSSRTDADQARDRLRATGFDGAFVRASSGASTPSQYSVTTYSADVAETSSQDSFEGEGEVVMLDGRLHRKVGDRFIPLQE